MKKRIFLIILSCLIIILTAGSLLASRFLIGNPFPFDYLTVDDIESVMVNAFPPDTPKPMSDDEITEMVQLLNSVEVFRRQRIPRNNLVGQSVQYNVHKRNGAQLTIEVIPPWVTINGVEYRSQDSYFELNELSILANTILGTPFGRQGD